MNLTQKILKTLLHYNPETGVFTWLKRDEKWFASAKNPQRMCNIWNTRYSGKEAGQALRGKATNTAYVYIGIKLIGEKKKKYYAHRLAFLYMDGKFPDGKILHKNGNGLNNKFSDLVCGTHQENLKDCAISRNNTSGFNGVAWHSQANKWRVFITINKRYIHGGLFADIGDAIEKRRQMNVEYGFHKDHGRRKHAPNY